MNKKTTEKVLQSTRKHKFCRRYEKSDEKDTKKDYKMELKLYRKNS